MTEWIRCYWDEEDIWYYFEVDTDGWVTRQVELHGPRQEPTTAASLDEWQLEFAAGRIQEYQARYGVLADQPVTEWEGHDPQPLSAAEFEQVWNCARHHLQAST
jgi:hypothetical protein